MTSDGQPGGPNPDPSDLGPAPILRRWLVSFASGPDWYPVGEFVALDAPSAIERAVEVFGPGSAYEAEEVPWDAAPLLRLRPPPQR